MKSLIEMATDSICIQGKITSLIRGLPDGSYESDKKNLVTMVIKEDTTKYLADFPIPTMTNLDILSIRSALIGLEVQYSKRIADEESEYTFEYDMKILSGKMKGDSYSGKR